MRAAVTVKPKADGDVDASVALLAAVAREGTFIATEWPFDMLARAQAMRDALQTQRAVGWVAVDGRAVVGDLMIFQPAEPEPFLGMIVAAAHRRRGIGRALIEIALAWAVVNEKFALRLRVFPGNAPALALYRESGFIDIGLEHNAVERSDGSALDAIVMRRPLPR